MVSIMRTVTNLSGTQLLSMNVDDSEAGLRTNVLFNYIRYSSYYTFSLFSLLERPRLYSLS